MHLLADAGKQDLGIINMQSFTQFVVYFRCLVHRKIKSFFSYAYSCAYVHRIFI